MRVATFGSCLSRFAGANYTYLFGGQIVSSVYHNRSDVYAGRFIDLDMEELRASEIIDKLKPTSAGTSVDNDASIIIDNQLRSGHGKHRLKRGLPFLDALDQKKVDLIIFDNYMDLGVKLLRVDGTSEGSEWFLRPSDLKDPQTCQPGELVSPEVGAQAMLKIIAMAKSKVPDADLVFCNFPHNT